MLFQAETTSIISEQGKGPQVQRQGAAQENKDLIYLRLNTHPALLKTTSFRCKVTCAGGLSA